MRVAVYGAMGMLGSVVVKELMKNNHVFCGSVNHGVDAIINCAGVIPQRRPNDTYTMIDSNAMLPHSLAHNFKGRIIHVSTDCVFNGRRPGIVPYDDTDQPDATTTYGMSKALGEVHEPNVCNVRTSFIGQAHGLLAWLLNSQEPELPGYVNAMWSGSSVEVVAQHLVEMLDQPKLPNVLHLSTREPISKYFLLLTLVQHFGLSVKITPVFEPVINRALKPSFTWSELPVITSVYPLNREVMV